MRDKSRQCVMRWTAGTFGVVTLDSPLLLSVTFLYVRVKVQCVVAESEIAEKLLVEVCEYSLVVCLRKLVEVTHVVLTARTAFPTKHFVPRRPQCHFG